MRFLKKLISWLFILVLIVCVALWLTRNVLVKVGVPIAAKTFANLDAGVGEANIKWDLGEVTLKNIVLNNPAPFPAEPMLVVPEIYERCDVSTLVRPPLHIMELRLDVKELTIAKSKEGTFNVIALMPPKKEDKTPTGPAKPAGEGAKMKIDLLKVRIGSLTYKDYSANPPVVKTVKLDLEVEQKDITDPAKVAAIIVGKAVAKGGADIPELGALAATEALKGVAGALDGVLSSPGGVTGAVEKVKGVLDALSGAKK